MKKQIPLAALACLLTLPAAAAADSPQQAPAPEPSAPSVSAASLPGAAVYADVPMFGPNQPIVSNVGTAPVLSSGEVIAIGDVEKRVRHDNLQLRALSEMIKSVKDQDPQDAIDALQAGYQQLSGSVSGMQTLLTSLPDTPENAATRMLITSNISILSSQAETMKTQMTSIRDNYDEQLDTLMETFSDTEDQLVFAAESTFIAIKAMEGSYDDLLRQRTTLAATVSEMEKRFELGQISALTLQQTKNGYTQLESGIATLAMNIENTKGDLNLLLGRDADDAYSLAALPLVADDQISSIHYENDVKTVRRRSTEIRKAADSLDQAEEQDNRYAERSARLSYDSTVRSVSQNFQKLCRAVTDKRQLVNAAQSDYSLAAKEFAVQETKFQNGQISQNAYDSAKATLETSANAVTTAQNNLYTAYMKYEWAKKGIVSAS